METTEKVVEAYCRYIHGLATIPNIRATGQHEIDLLAINPATGARYHIEVSVSISSGFSKLTAKPFDEAKAKTRTGAPSQRRTVGFFLNRKFEAPGVLETLKTYGFEPGDYQRVIVSWDWTAEAETQADDAGIELWSFPRILNTIGERFRNTKAYFMDDTLRTLQLAALADKTLTKPPTKSAAKAVDVPADDRDPFQAYLLASGRSARTTYTYSLRIRDLLSSGLPQNLPQAEFDELLASRSPSTHGQLKSARNAYLAYLSTT